MKIQIALTTVALLPLAAFSQTPTPNDSPAQPALAAAPAAPAVAPVPPVPPAPPAHSWMHDEDRPNEPVTFLGVETSRVPRVLSEQLNLPRGFGVVVDYVVPNSAAAAAGVQPSDVLRMLNDQIIIDSDQLGVLVRSFADGATVSLTVLRKGQEMKLTAKLQQKKERAGRGPVGYEFNFDDLDRLKNFQMPDMTAVREAVARAKKEALRAGDEARAAARRLRIVTDDDGTVKTSHVDLGKAQIVFTDEKGELRLESVDGKKMLTAKDPSGKVIFSGPIDNAEERAKIPPDVRKRYESLEHQELPAIPPNDELAPRPPNPDDGASLRSVQLPRANRSGWVRNTILL